ncbi:hypothetical protein [Methylobacterium thuringiense]|uniref:hypothetical protein n=1 Tax=Methylobacterium thuringiense TaxID=1003091 RepID=UPI001EDE0F9D|nr:hypothetical protein [Methylobacterium thuringiense]
MQVLKDDAVTCLDDVGALPPERSSEGYGRWIGGMRSSESSMASIAFAAPSMMVAAGFVM